MALPAEEKQKIIKEFATVKSDTGSPEIQIALLTAKIQRLSDHLKEHKKDIHSRRGLLSMISKRRRLLNYLLKEDKKKSTDRYKNIITRLKLSK